MSETDNHEDKIWNLIDQFVDMANSSCEDGLSPGDVHQALMYASARWGAFIVAANSETRDEFREDIKDSQKFFLDQFREYLKDNFNEYDENFKIYRREED
ncbi:DUF3144 domain-containing protein [Sessilibacter corallicola]|uniref:DUF3144 domain-containing protein n=1 Tax=Sessilibacter corallicola TaxID=2904075 RepID=UPI001E52B62D|nr:DUF3144 domain-containing protein [Sessilibacter corallicola]MCE2028935.1 DUF3144 domain-containing protein [Sessilibacter corallicola]